MLIGFRRTARRVRRLVVRFRATFFLRDGLDRTFAAARRLRVRAAFFAAALRAAALAARVRAALRAAARRFAEVVALRLVALRRGLDANAARTLVRLRAVETPRRLRLSPVLEARDALLPGFRFFFAVRLRLSAAFATDDLTNFPPRM